MIGFFRITVKRCPKYCFSSEIKSDKADSKIRAIYGFASATFIASQPAVTGKIYPNMRRPLLFLYLEAPKLGRSSGVIEHLWLKARH